MRIFTAWCATVCLGSLVAAVPALRGLNIDDKCVIETIYVIVTTSVSAVDVSLVATASLQDNIAQIAAALTEVTETYTPELLNSSLHLPVVVSTTHTIHEKMHTIHETHFLTKTVTGDRGTNIKTIEVYHGLSTVPSVAYATGPQSRISGADGNVVVTNSVTTISSTNSQGIEGNPTITLTPVSIGDYGTSTEIVHPNGLLLSVVESGMTSQFSGLTHKPDETTLSRTLIVTVFETLTVIPLLAVPSSSRSGEGNFTTVVQSTIAISHKLAITEGQPDLKSSTDVPTTATLSTSCVGKNVPGYGYGGWNISLSGSAESPVTIFATISVATQSGVTVDPVTEASLVMTTVSVTLSSSQTPVTQTSLNAGPFTRPFNASVSAVFSGPSFPTANNLTLLHSSIATDFVPASPDVSINNISPNATNPTQQTLQTSYPSISNLGSIEASSPMTLSINSTTLASSTTFSSSAVHVTSLSSEDVGASKLSSEILFPSSTLLVSASTALSNFVSETALALSKNMANTSAQSIPLPRSSSGALGVNSSLPMNTTSTLVASSVASTASAAPTACGEQGNFTLNFDDLPPLSVTNNSTAQPMPLFSPYHQFFFSDGFSVVPPPTDPYKPSSKPLLVEFLFDSDTSTPTTSTGEVSNDRTALFRCFNFNALGASLGCDSQGPNCDWQFTGLRYNFTSGKEDFVVTQIFTTSSCPELSNCNLVPIALDNTFQNLTTLQINVTVAGAPKIWWMDDLQLGWYDDSCAAGLCRKNNI